MASALETGALVPVSQKAAQDYAAHADNLLNYVDACMKKAPLDALAAKQVEMMLQNHRNHLQFMMSFFRLNNPELLKEIVIWVYRAYQAHGFSPDYFPAVLRRWMEAVSQFLPPESAPEILGVYGWMLENHQRFLAAADEYRHMEQEAAGAPHPLQALRNEFLQGLIAGSLSRCNACATGYITGKDELREFYLGVVQPAMIEIGNLWERGELSVAREHLATAIVTRIMAAQHMRFFGLEKPKGKALISA
ncbi:MAG TPA: B12-binding domain-containing protein, partial [Synergistales bacterium]|nr:B12-binding domain-containing protein [Synergistales bacterium]